MKHLSRCYQNWLQACHNKSKRKLLPVYAMKAHREVELQLHVLDGCKCGQLYAPATLRPEKET